MDMEKPRDFGSLRAMFQNDSNFSNMLLESVKKPSAKFSPQQNAGGSSVSCHTPKPLHQRQVPDPEQQTKQFSYTSQKLEIRQVKPMVFPKVKIKDRKDSNLSLAICKPSSLGEESPKPHPRYCLSPQGSEGASSSFCNTLHIWKSALAQGDQKYDATPPQCTIRTTSLSHPQVANVAILTEDKAKIAGLKQGMVLDVCKPQSHVYNEFVPTTSPPVPPRSHTSLNKAVAGFFPSSLNNLNSLSKASNGRCSDDEDAKVPKIKLLPSIKELGHPPKKPPRPPKVDLGAFQQNFPDAADDAYLTPEITEMEDLNTYEETIYYQEQQENCPNSTQRPIHSFKSVKKEDTKICSPRSIFMKPRNRGNEKNMPQEETNQSFSGGELAKDGDFSDDYVCLESLRADEEKWNPDLRTAKLEQAAEEVYDDVEGIERDLQSSDAHRSFALDSNDTYEDTYEDIQSEIQSEGYNSSKSEDIKVEKLKGFGKFFKEKLKIKTAHMKGSSRNLSRSVPNLDVMAQGNFMYNDIDPEQNDTKNPFKVKKYIVEKNNKMTKEEQSFRERFMYNKEITVINTAVVHCSNTPIRGNLDLRILPGEQLEVIDITEGNQLICRNSEGKYGYVLLEHLNFRH
ncbi:FYN-binding protein 2 isoform X3 [Protobothrops mucrosquamatus]|uniref:FYN-binding protein 2 isoform X3 n=2 Tax=Protobothrops mucrosquamatus TaxID=103944 RepID=UPI0007756182|nr:FYN-binding protein 2 isoform X3 [Protobothrops mucrosquamatus]